MKTRRPHKRAIGEHAALARMLAGPAPKQADESTATEHIAGDPQSTPNATKAGNVTPELSATSKPAERE
jgi:hypothetical protein